jgi:hypothetical protein
MKLTSDSVARILELGKNGKGLFDIAKELRVPTNLVRRVRNSHTYGQGGTYSVIGSKPVIRPKGRR